MEIELNAIISLFLLLLIASGVFLFSEKFKKIPYTVLLTCAGLLLGIFNQLIPLPILSAFTLTPGMLFYVFLPILIFESAYNVNLRDFYKSIVSITLLSTVGLIISAVIVAVLIMYGASLANLNLPLVMALLFGSIISATDPVAVLSIFKEIGVPRRLSLIFEGESLFNDGTAVAFFIVILSAATFGFKGWSTVATGAGTFLIMVLGGIFFGLISGKLFSRFLKINRKNQSSSLIIMLVMAHLTFLGAEWINEFAIAQNVAFAISPIIATTVASLYLGNEGKKYLSHHATEYFEKFWSSTAFMVNSLVFLLMGLLIVQMDILKSELLLLVIMGALSVSIARALSVFLTIGIVNIGKFEPPIPKSWTTLLSFGSLRGALAVIVVLTIPDTFTIAGWVYSFTPKELLLSMVIGAVIGSLLIKATSIKWLIDKLNISQLGATDSVRLLETRAFITSLGLEKISTLKAKGYIDAHLYEDLVTSLKKELATTRTSASEDIVRGIFTSYAIGIEQYHLQELYARSEITEEIYKHIQTKLIIQKERIEKEHLPDGECGRFGTVLMRERLDHYNKKLQRTATGNFSLRDKYLYYRCLAIIARKVLKELEPKHFRPEDIAIIETILESYVVYVAENNKRMENIQTENPELTSAINHEMLQYSLKDFHEKISEKLHKMHFLNAEIENKIFEEKN
jgi:CPA1 family monovalent cation:H+ antiporter